MLSTGAQIRLAALGPTCWLAFHRGAARAKLRSTFKQDANNNRPRYVGVRAKLKAPTLRVVTANG